MKEECAQSGRKAGRRLSAGPAAIGGIVTELMEKRISPRHERFDMVSGLWQQLLPVELGQHCRLAQIKGGLLKVLVDSPAYMYELQLCSSELLEQLQHRCPRAGIIQIKISLG